jgi:hypothetical protein
MPPEEHARLSASSSERWMKCPRSVALCEKLPQEESSYAEEGTLAHAFAEKLLRMYAERGRTDFAPVELKSVTVKQEDGSDKEVKVEQEMVNAILFYVKEISETFEGLKLKDPDARILIEQRVNFDHWVPGGFGTSDCVMISQGICHVFDLKYGKGVQVDGRANTQLRLYALGAYEELNWEADIQSFETHIIQPRLNWVSGEAITKDDLLTWGDKTKVLAEMADKDQGDFNPGPWCSEGFCPARDLCKHRALAVLKELRDAVESSGDGFTPDLMGEEARSKFAKTAAPLQKLCNDVESRMLTDIVNGQPHPGWKAVSGRASRDWDDPEKLKRQLQDMGYRLMDVCSPQELLSPTQLKLAIKTVDYKTIAAPHITIVPGRPQLAPEDDPREDYKPASAQEDFKDLINKEGSKK